MKEVLKRLKSPVVIAQIVSIIATIIVAVMPEKQEYIEKIVYSITVLINLFSGVNNPTDREHF